MEDFPICHQILAEGTRRSSSNMGARVFDFIPFIAIGMAADYYNPDNPQFTNSRIESFVTIESIPDLGPNKLN